MFLGSLDFGFAGSELTINGALTVNAPLEGGTLLLVREENTTTLDTDEAPIPGGFLHANITWSQGDPFTLNIAPYTSDPAGLNGTSVWIEVSSEIALIKLVGTSRVVTLVPQVLAQQPSSNKRTFEPAAASEVHSATSSSSGI